MYGLKTQMRKYCTYAKHYCTCIYKSMRVHGFHETADTHTCLIHVCTMHGAFNFWLICTVSKIVRNWTVHSRLQEVQSFLLLYLQLWRYWQYNMQCATYQYFLKRIVLYWNRKYWYIAILYLQSVEHSFLQQRKIQKHWDWSLLHLTHQDMTIHS